MEQKMLHAVLLLELHIEIYDGVIYSCAAGSEYRSTFLGQNSYSGDKDILIETHKNQLLVLCSIK
jgi:hypothetical protein